MAAKHYRPAELVFGWSFYRQGTSGGSSSADEFLDAALTWCGDPDPRLGTGSPTKHGGFHPDKGCSNAFGDNPMRVLVPLLEFNRNPVFRVFVTNRDDPALDIWRDYNGRACVERRIDELKNELAADHSLCHGCGRIRVRGCCLPDAQRSGGFQRILRRGTFLASSSRIHFAALPMWKWG